MYIPVFIHTMQSIHTIMYNISSDGVAMLHVCSYSHTCVNQLSPDVRTPLRIHTRLLAKSLDLECCLQRFGSSKLSTSCAVAMGKPHPLTVSYMYMYMH